MKKIIAKHWGIVCILIIYVSLLTYKTALKPTPFYDWDESIYAQVGKEMIKDKSFFVPLWQGKPWLDKPFIPPLVYGIMEILPIQAEFSTRFLTLILSAIVLAFVYTLSFRITKHTVLSFLAATTTAFLPGFIQRSQTLNVDVFLLVGWFGYILFYEHFLWSTLFLLVGVLSKSLLGLYPPLLFILFHTYELLTKRVSKHIYIQLLKKIALQMLISLMWFIFMFFIYGFDFIKYHFLESHLKRVTASIEQHFGKRTFYFDILAAEVKWLLIPSLLAVFVIVLQFFKQNSDKKKIFLSLFFLPWFLFLNATKTKIAWYIYPVLPQFAFLAAYPVIFFRKKTIAVILYCGLSLYILFTQITPFKTVISSQYSTYDDHIKIAQIAKNINCKALYVLVGSDTRNSYKTLQSMDLVITTTTWWGNHPSIAYYSEAKTSYIYSINDMNGLFLNAYKDSCYIIEKNDASAVQNHQSRLVQTQNNTYLLYKR